MPSAMARRKRTRHRSCRAGVATATLALCVVGAGLVDAPLSASAALSVSAQVSASPAGPPQPWPATPHFPSWIDDFASYDGQRTCVSTPQPGAQGLADLLRATYAAVRTVGITRRCGVGSVSEHKEGRALDVMVGRSPSGRAIASAILGWLLSADSYGNAAANARRLGVMYLIWNRQIWRAYRPEAGWQPYTGGEAHTDHIHVSLSWAGALKRTSWWSLDPMTTPGRHLLHGTWWDVTCSYAARPRATCLDQVLRPTVVRNPVTGRYRTRIAFIRDHLTLVDRVRPLWNSQRGARTGTYTAANGRRWKVSCTAEPPGPRTCQRWIWSSPVEAVTVGHGAYAVTTYQRRPQWVLCSVLRLRAPSRA